MAVITRVIAAKIIVKRLGPLMEEAGMAVTILGANADLNDPFAWSYRQVGGSTADHSTVTDVELALMAVADYDDFTNLSEYRTLMNLIGNLDDVDIVTGPRSEKLHQLVQQAERKLEHLEEVLAPILDAAPTSGYITLDFAEHSETRL